MRLSSVGPYRWIATIYIEFFRGLPAIIVLHRVRPAAAGLPGPGHPVRPLRHGLDRPRPRRRAYMAETIRAGIQAVPKGQIEAARSLGMPAGARCARSSSRRRSGSSLPPLTNELILLVKDSSLVYILGLSTAGYELTKYGRDLPTPTPTSPRSWSPASATC